MSNSSKVLAATNSAKSLLVSNSDKSLVISNSAKALVVSNSGNRLDQIGKKKYVKQVTGRHNDTELHLAAKRGDVAAVKEILAEINAQMMRTANSVDFDAEVAEIREAMVNDVNELGETALFMAAEKGHTDVVKELLPYTTKEGISAKNQSGFDPLHIAASQGHHGIFLNQLRLLFCFIVVVYCDFVLFLVKNYGLISKLMVSVYFCVEWRMMHLDGLNK